MTKTAEKLASEIHSLPDVEKLRLVDAILTDLAKPDPGPGGRTLMHALRGELGKRQLETKN